MLHQDTWSAADDLGRIKVIISEVFFSAMQTVETVKNIVAFSFQHAPLCKPPGVSPILALTSVE